MAKHATNGFRNELCGRVNRSGPIPSDMRSSAGSSIVLDGCSFQGNADHAFGAEVYLIEIPAQLIIRNSWMQAEMSGGVQNSVILKVDPAIDLDGPYMPSPGRVISTPVFDISSNNWGVHPPQADLPEQLRPYQVGRVEGTRPPQSGVWQVGQVVHNRLPRVAMLGEAESPPLGWMCVKSGQPGLWVNISSPPLE